MILHILLPNKVRNPTYFAFFEIFVILDFFWVFLLLPPPPPPPLLPLSPPPAGGGEERRGEEREGGHCVPHTVHVQPYPLSLLRTKPNICTAAGPMGIEQQSVGRSDLNSNYLKCELLFHVGSVDPGDYSSGYRGL